MTRMHEVVERVLALSRADDCIVIATHSSSANLRWANNTSTTNGAGVTHSLVVISIIGRRVGTAARTFFPDDLLEDVVRESEAACTAAPEAHDYFSLVDAPSPGEWTDPAPEAGIEVLAGAVPGLAAVFARADSEDRRTFGFAEHDMSTIWVAASNGMRRRYTERRGKIEMTAKSADLERSAWTGHATTAFDNVDANAMYERLRKRLEWSARAQSLPAGRYEVLLEPSGAADIALEAYFYSGARDADEGRSVYAKPGGGNRIGERLYPTNVGYYSDPAEPGLETLPFVVAMASRDSQSLFDNGLAISRTDWAKDGVLHALPSTRSWAARAGAAEVRPFVSNLVMTGDGPDLDDMIARTRSGLLVTCLWYIRVVDPQTLLLTGLTRDGVFLIEDGEVRAAVNNFRFNMSPLDTLAQTTEVGRSQFALPRENDEFLLTKAPPLRIADFNMSSVSEAT
ncbi:MAG: metallopeptidase TldD-related protein [Actinomycetota bacterium]